MFSKYSLASTCMVATQALMNVKQQVAGGLDFLAPLNLAQTGASDSCCCSVIPCMPMCMKPCNDEPVVIPDEKDDKALPTPVRDVIFNLDVILTTLMH